MASTITFNKILDTVGLLPDEDQEILAEILKHRLIEKRRLSLAKAIKQAEKEFKKGQCKAATPEQIIQEITS